MRKSKDFTVTGRDSDAPEKQRCGKLEKIVFFRIVPAAIIVLSTGFLIWTMNTHCHVTEGVCLFMVSMATLFAGETANN